MASQSEKPVLIFDRGRDSLHESILNGDTPEDLPELRAAFVGASRYPNARVIVCAFDEKPSQNATGLRAATHYSAPAGTKGLWRRQQAAPGCPG